MLAATSADNRLTIWDLSAENKEEDGEGDAEVQVPDELMFIH